MPGVKYAKPQVASIWLDCPHCGEGQVNADGSLMIDLHDAMFTGAGSGKMFTCQSCGRTFRIQSWAKLNG